VCIGRPVYVLLLCRATRVMDVVKRCTVERAARCSVVITIVISSLLKAESAARLLLGRFCAI